MWSAGFLRRDFAYRCGARGALTVSCMCGVSYGCLVLRDLGGFKRAEDGPLALRNSPDGGRRGIGRVRRVGYFFAGGFCIRRPCMSRFCMRRVCTRFFAEKVVVVVSDAAYRWRRDGRQRNVGIECCRVRHVPVDASLVGLDVGEVFVLAAEAWLA